MQVWWQLSSTTRMELSSILVLHAGCYRHTLTVCYTYYFFTVTVVARMRLSVTSIVHCPPCLKIFLILSSCPPRCLLGCLFRLKQWIQFSSPGCMLHVPPSWSVQSHAMWHGNSWPFLSASLPHSWPTDCTEPFSASRKTSYQYRQLQYIIPCKRFYLQSSIV